MSQNPRDLNNELLRSLLDTVSRLSSTLDLDVLLDLVMDSACRVLRAGATSLLLLDQATNALFFKTATGEKREELKHIRLELGDGIAGWVAKHGKPLRVGDVWSDPKFKREISEAIDYDTQTILCVPLKIRGQVIGVMEALNKLGGSEFSDEDLEALTLLADHVAIAVDNARRFGEASVAREGFQSFLEERYQAIGSSPVFAALMKTARKVAATRSTVLLRGESGTGKEVVARAIHAASPRARRSLIAVNCAALTETLLESELFGHEKGAFTGADRRKKGKFELADMGTLFLDEIGCMTPQLQTRLLRVLQEREIDRLGGDRPIPVDVRVIAATNADLEEEMKAGRFREDLFYRLNVITIQIPPLRERRNDIPALARHFIQRYNAETNSEVKGLSPEALQVLMTYSFPGNVRELENMMERAVVLEEEPWIQPERLPIPTTDAAEISSAPPEPDASSSGPVSLQELERRHILQVLHQCDWKKSRACNVLEISRPTLDRKLTAYGVTRRGTEPASSSDGS